jgi:hypothetical protein
VLVTGKPYRTALPAPFDQVHGLPDWLSHQVHHKFVVCDFNGDTPVVYCGSSNLAEGGEYENGDNLLEIRDQDVATVFAIEAAALVDHFDFLDRYATPRSASPAGTRGSTGSGGSGGVAAAATPPPETEWHLGTTAAWAAPYFDEDDLKYADRLLFAHPR